VSRYLPLVLRATCHTRFVDVALVLDTSTSMLQTGIDGRTKLEASVDAAGRFLDRLDLANRVPPRDRAAVVAFNAEARVLQSLTGDRSRLGAALAGLDRGVAEGTRLDLALGMARSAVSGGDRPQASLPVLLLLTDGLPNRVPPAEDGRPETTVLRAADEAKRAGIRVYTVGLGQPGQIHADLLRAVASAPGMYREAPDASQLRSIYAELADVVHCEP
jgi:Mg-chelatase subunit ChlD